MLQEEIDAMVDYVKDELYCAERGAETDLIISPGGIQDGIEYGPISIKVVSLNEGEEVAYRFESDETNSQWYVGDSVDTAAYWLTRKEVIDNS